MTAPTATDARNTVETLSEGDVIRIPQYENELRVNYLGELGGVENAFIGVEFADESKQTGTGKRLMVNALGGDDAVFLQAGTADKGEVTEIEVVVSRGTDSDNQEQEPVIRDGGTQTTLEEVTTSEDTTDNESPQDGTEGAQDNDGNTSRAYGWGSGRRNTLAAIESKDRLDPVQSFTSIDDMTEAVREINLPMAPGSDSWYKAPPEDVIETIERVYDNLPDEAKQAYLNDDTLHRRINASRRYFSETWLGRLKREKEMPSPAEAGPSNYPAEKAREKCRLRHESSDELTEKIDRIKQGVRGGRQRALNKIGSSVAEENAKQEQNERETLRDCLESGQILQYRNPNRQIGAIKRVNTKSVRLIRPNPRAGGTKPLSDEPEPDYRKETVDLKAKWLTLIDRGSLDNELETLREFYKDIPDDYDEAVTFLSGGEVDAYTEK